MKKRLCAGIAFAFFASGCAGSGPDPVARYAPRDEKRACASLQAEIRANRKEIARKNAERTEKTLQNLGLGAAGVFLVVPWFFMDIKGKEAVETEALERRNAALRRIAFEKGCNAPPPVGAHEKKADQKTDEKSHQKQGRLSPARVGVKKFMRVYATKDAEAAILKETGKSAWRWKEAWPGEVR